MMQDDAAITPVISESSANFIEGLVKDAEAKNATFVTPYKREKNLIWPTLIDNVTADMRIAWEEPFGPVMPVIRVKTIQDAIDHCNSNNLALQVSARPVFDAALCRVLHTTDSLLVLCLS